VGEVVVGASVGESGGDIYIFCLINSCFLFVLEAKENTWDYQ
jgi:hypothetical protein